MDEFLDWLMELYDCGSLSDDEIERALKDDYFAYDMFIDCWTCDKTGTAMMAKEAFVKVKLCIDRKKRNAKKDT